RVTLTTGHTLTTDDAGLYHVPITDLVTCLQLLLQERRLKVPRTLPDADNLVRELTSFRAQVVLSAEQPSASWREGPQDDLVLAVALACRWAERHIPWTLKPSNAENQSLVDQAPEGVFFT